MARVDLSTLSTEYVRVRVTAREGGALVNPTGQSVWLAFLDENDLDNNGGDPAPADWLVAGWETAGTTYYARAMVGPGVGGVITLAPGNYRIWCKLDATPEHPVKSVGRLYVF